MPRVLIVAYYFPPRQTIGALRPGAFAKYLPQFGWEPVVLTPAMAGRGGEPFEIAETGYRDVLADWKKKLRLNPNRGLHDQLKLATTSKPGTTPWHSKVVNVASSILTYPDPTKGWIPFAEEAVKKLPANGGIDAILSTSPPPSTHMIAARAKAILRCPWVADFRDLWTQNFASTHDRLVLSMQSRLEKKILSSADVLTVVSAPWAERLKQRYPHKDVRVVTNGFDPDDFRGAHPPLTQQFTITYTGTLYEGKRDPSALFEVLAEMLDSGVIQRDDVRVRFYSPAEPWLLVGIRQRKLEDVVEIPGLVKRKEVLARQQESQVLLQLGWSDPRETGQHTGKLFEYLGAQRPILAVGGSRGALTEVLEETNTGAHPQSHAELREFLLNAYRQFKTLGSVGYQPNSAAIERYTHPQMAQNMAGVLDSLTGRVNQVNQKLRPEEALTVSPTR